MDKKEREALLQKAYDLWDFSMKGITEDAPSVQLQESTML